MDVRDDDIPINETWKHSSFRIHSKHICTIISNSTNKSQKVLTQIYRNYTKERTKQVIPRLPPEKKKKKEENERKGEERRV